MERLTDHSLDDYNDPGCQECSDYAWRCCKENENIDSCLRRKIYNRLAAYEDTGLDLEEIMGLCDMDRRAKMADLLRLEEYQALGPIKELTALVKARRDGRVVVLPCKRGDEVRATVKRPYNGHTAEINGIVSDIQTVVRVSYDGTRYVDFLGSDFGKTVFLTRAEAEAAIGGGGDG